MNKSLIAIALAAVALSAGCTAHNDSPKTPMIVGTTPTYRSTARSTDLFVGPYYTQPGVNAGTPVSLPVIPSQDRWDPNDPVATQVYTALTSANSIELKFLRVYAHKGTIWLQGSVHSKDQAERAAKIAKSITGVVTVINDLRAHA